eukprot:820546-Prymnesium_polylepis.1
MEGGGEVKLAGTKLRAEGEAEARYHTAREQRWRAALAKAQGKSALRMKSPSGAVHAHSAA